MPELKAYVPKDPHDFGFLLQIMAGPVDEEGEESFDVVVCSARWLTHHLGPDGILVGRHHLIVDSYDYPKLERFLRDCFERCSGSSWEEVAAKLGRLGKWEFEDYNP